MILDKQHIAYCLRFVVRNSDDWDFNDDEELLIKSFIAEIPEICLFNPYDLLAIEVKVSVQNIAKERVRCNPEFYLWLQNDFTNWAQMGDLNFVKEIYYSKPEYLTKYPRIQQNLLHWSPIV